RADVRAFGVRAERGSERARTDGGKDHRRCRRDQAARAHRGAVLAGTPRDETNEAAEAVEADLATDRKRDREGRALAELGVDPNSTALRDHQAVHDVEAEPDTGMPTGVRCLTEAIEDLRQLVRRD